MADEYKEITISGLDKVVFQDLPVHNTEVLSIQIQNDGAGTLIGSAFSGRKDLRLKVTPLPYGAVTPRDKLTIDSLAPGDSHIFTVYVGDVSFFTFLLSTSGSVDLKISYKHDSRREQPAPKDNLGKIEVSGSGGGGGGNVLVTDPITADQQRVSSTGAAKTQIEYRDTPFTMASGLLSDGESVPITGAGKYKGGWNIEIDGVVNSGGGSGAGKVTLHARVRGRPWAPDTVFVYTIPAIAGAFQELWLIPDRFDELKLVFSGIPGANLNGGINAYGVGFEE